MEEERKAAAAPTAEEIEKITEEAAAPTADGAENAAEDVAEDAAEGVAEDTAEDADAGSAEAADGKNGKKAKKAPMRLFVGRDALEWTGTAAFGAAVMLLGALLATSVKAGLTGTDLLLTPLRIVSYDIWLGILLLYWALATFAAPRKGCRLLVLPAVLDLGMTVYEFTDSAVMLGALVYANVIKHPMAEILNRNYFRPLVLGKTLPTLLHVILLIGLIVALLGGMKHRWPHLVICIGYAAAYAVLAVIDLAETGSQQDLCILLMHSLNSLLRFFIYGLPVAYGRRVAKADLTETRLTDALRYLEQHRKDTKKDADDETAAPTETSEEIQTEAEEALPEAADAASAAPSEAAEQTSPENTAPENTVPESNK